MLILLLAGSLCLFTSLFSKWLPGAQGRFDGQQRGGRYSALPSAATGAKAAPAQIPPRPRRLSLPMLVVCIVIRLEIFHRVNYQQQCSTPGIEVSSRDPMPYSLRLMHEPVISLPFTMGI